MRQSRHRCGGSERWSMLFTSVRQLCSSCSHTFRVSRAASGSWSWRMVLIYGRTYSRGIKSVFKSSQFSSSKTSFISCISWETSMAFLIFLWRNRAEQSEKSTDRRKTTFFEREGGGLGIGKVHCSVLDYVMGWHIYSGSVDHDIQVWWVSLKTSCSDDHEEDECNHCI